MKYKIGILDNEFSYSEALMEYINRNYSNDMSVVIFKNRASLLEYFDQDYVDMMLISEYYKDDVKGDRIITYISEDRSRCDEDNIFKYQSAKLIVDILMQRLRTRDKNRPDDGFLIGVFSPIGRCGKTEFSLALCNNRNGSLYIGFEDNVCIGRYSGIGMDISSIKSVGQRFLYLLATKNPDIVNIIDNLPMLNGFKLLIVTGGAKDIGLIERDSIDWFKKVMLEQGGIPGIVIDFGVSVMSDSRLLLCFDQVYMLRLEDEWSAGKLEFYVRENEEVLKELGSRLRYINVPCAGFESEEFKILMERYRI